MLGGRVTGIAQASARPARRATPRAHPSSAAATSSTPPAASSTDDAVGVDLEAGVGRAHVVGDHEVDPLGRELGRRVLPEPLGLGREADHDLPGALARAELGEDVGGRLEHDLGHAVALLHLLAARPPWAGSRRPRRP